MAVEPFRSLKTMVTVLRSSRTGNAGGRCGQRRTAVAAQLELGRVLFAAAGAVDHGRSLGEGPCPALLAPGDAGAFTVAAWHSRQPHSASDAIDSRPRAAAAPYLVCEHCDAVYRNRAARRGRFAALPPLRRGAGARPRPAARWPARPHARRAAGVSDRQPVADRHAGAARHPHRGLAAARHLAHLAGGRAPGGRAQHSPPPSCFRSA